MTVDLINSRHSQAIINKPLKLKKIIGFSVLAAILIGVGYAWYLFQKPHQGIANVKPHFTLNAPSLAGEFEADEKTANEKYLGKVIEVSGVISEKVQDEKGKYNITLQGADLAGVGCEFDRTFAQKVGALKEGQEVKIKGLCTGMLMDVVLSDCIIVE